MADQSSNYPSHNSTQNHTNKPISSFLGSPRIFNGLLTRSLSDIGTIQTSRDRRYDNEIVTSPNSLLDGMQNLNIGNPFGYDRKSPNPINKKLPIIKTTPNNMPRFQTSQDRLYDAECIVSSNSTLDGMQNDNLGNPFGYDRKPPNPFTKKPPNNKLESEITSTSQFQTSQNGNLFGYDRKPPNPITKKHSNNKMESESIGLALIDPKVTSEKFHVLFGAKLKVEIPCSIEVKNSTCGDLDEMESSEDYTCVITHGPNPKTTHIFDNCIIESSCGVRKLRENSCKVDHTKGKGI
ncbi:uncharacterized protein [Solanum tuberosum]|uniref:Uncharacterized protein n=1 Tax=Solanum tuberosum TaxID=4113 RepID=M1B657_SOLTU|nr:PREDICTED: uncharacterized protein LOC102582218 [Solanum tuberosum]XP_015168019.1 PREDICTED: uncharacterized protein LOC102582218 [Solanum tuberosum]